MKESRKDFIREAHKSACETWKQKIEKEFPKLFKDLEPKEGKWHKANYSSSYLIFAEEIKHGLVTKGYGFYDDGKWFDIPKECGIRSTVPASNEDVEQALINEAKKRGYKEGVLCKCLYDCDNFKCEGAFNFDCDGDLWFGSMVMIFSKGKWAEFITKIITKSEAEKQLNAKIID